MEENAKNFSNMICDIECEAYLDLRKRNEKCFNGKQVLKCREIYFEFKGCEAVQ